jgi:hypothetical protein
MNEPPTSDWTNVNAAADRFERGWKQTPQSRIEDFLAEVGEKQRAKLFEELLRVELELRRSDGEGPSREEYTRRFPRYTRLIDAVFVTTLRSGATGGWSESLRAT